MTNEKHLTGYNLWDHYLKAICSWGNFTGRSPRSEFWGYYLFYFLFYIAWGELCRMAAGIYADVLITLYQLVFLFPGIALLFRRLHDTRRSGWHIMPVWILAAVFIMLQIGFYTPYESGISVLYILGALAAIANLCLFVIIGFFRSDPGYNEYGPNPYHILQIPPQKKISTVEI